MLSDAMIGLIRTFVPTVIGTIIAWLTAQGVLVDSAVEEQLSVAFIGLCVALYYGAVALLERKVNPAFGWLLGYPKSPEYGKDKGADEALVEEPAPPPPAVPERGEL